MLKIAEYDEYVKFLFGTLSVNEAVEILTEIKILPGNPRLSAIMFINIWAEYMAEQYNLSKGFSKILFVKKLRLLSYSKSQGL